MPADAPAADETDAAAAALSGLNLGAREWAPRAPALLSREQELAKLTEMANSINAAAAMAVLSGTASSAAYVPTLGSNSFVTSTAPSPMGEDSDDANLDEIEQAIATAEIEEFLDAQGAQEEPDRRITQCVVSDTMASIFTRRIDVIIAHCCV